MGHYRFYELDPSDHIMAGYSVECGSDADAMRAARTLLERAAGVEHDRDLSARTLVRVWALVLPAAAGGDRVPARTESGCR